ncbi:MAG: 30S ribosomal protein S11 [Patescibacteria group bacterium]|nr:30S ribosomal protein S11 [Patescibacteria group bacterium]
MPVETPTAAPAPVTPKAPAARPTEPKAGVAAERSARAKKVKRQVPVGRVYIQATYNNTIVTFTDPQGNVLAQSSAGLIGFRGPKKATPYAAGSIIRSAVTKVQGYGLREVNVFVKGFGSGREAAIRAINANGIAILGIKDVTPLPHNGCRPKKPRRI